MIRTGIAFTLLLIAALGAACSSDGSEADPTPTTADAVDGQPTESGATPMEGEETPDEGSVAVDVDGGDEPIFVYSGADVLGGEELTFADVFNAGKPVVLNFWAGLCPPCRQEMPDFQEVYNERSDEFLMFGVDVGPFTLLGDENDARDLLEELEVSYPTARVDSDTLIREYDVFGMPTTVFLTADGQVVSQKSGLISGDEFRDRVQEMIDASG